MILSKRSAQFFSPRTWLRLSIKADALLNRLITLVHLLMLKSVALKAVGNTCPRVSLTHLLFAVK